MDARRVNYKECLEWICMVSLSPIAFLLFTLMALYHLLQFFFRVGLLFIIVAIHTPFAVMYNVSLLVFEYNSFRFYNRIGIQKSSPGEKSSPAHWNWSDPRASLGTEVKVIVSDFLKVVAGEILLGVSTGIITYFTAPLEVFYISTAFWLVAIVHQWFNQDCLSKTALSCLFDGYGLSPVMFLCSYIGFFDIGCHPVAKCSFVASKAFFFVRDVPNKEVSPLSDHSKDVASTEESSPLSEHSKDVVLTNEVRTDFLRERDIEQGHGNSNEEDVLAKTVEVRPTSLTKSRDIEQGHGKSNEEDVQFELPQVRLAPYLNPCVIEQGHGKVKGIQSRLNDCATPIPVKQRDKESNADVSWYRFKGEMMKPDKLFIEFLHWNAFERGLFRLSPRIDFINKTPGKHILKSFMVLKLREVKLCEYPVERLELPEDYSKANELYNFLDKLSEEDGFVTDKMRGRYEHSLTLSEIAEGVEESVGYKTVDPVDKCFVVAGCIDLQQ